MITAYKQTLDLVDNEDNYKIDVKNHEKFSKKAVDNYKIQKGLDIGEIYKPGLMWDQILKSVKTYNIWLTEKDDSVLKNALLRFYRTDLIFGHSGDAYIWEIKNGELDLKLQVFMLIQRYKEFIRKSLSINSDLVTTTEIGHNIYTDYENKKLAFKTIRHAYYLDQIKRFNLLPETGAVVGELGCGAGEMAILTKRMYSDVKYVCFDLPETLMVSSYNVLMSFPDKKIGLFTDFMQAGNISKNDIQKYDIIMLPNWCIEWIESGAFDLFINIGSLSEMDLPIIDNYIRNIERICKGFFYTVNRNVNNVEEFGVKDIPVEKFPFSKIVEMVYSGYDVASDNFHSRYGMNYRCNYWEYIIDLKNKNK
jgi:putative sugar O-methyltransferase